MAHSLSCAVGLQLICKFVSGTVLLALIVQTISKLLVQVAQCH